MDDVVDITVETLNNPNLKPDCKCRNWEKDHSKRDFRTYKKTKQYR